MCVVELSTAVISGGESLLIGLQSVDRYSDVGRSTISSLPHANSVTLTGFLFFVMSTCIIHAFIGLRPVLTPMLNIVL